MRIIWFAILVFLLEFRTQFDWLGTVEPICSRRRAYHSWPRKMADARPTLSPGRSDIRSAYRTVQPPDDRTYSAEVTVFRRNLLHHRSARIASLHTLDYDITLSAFCQAQYTKKFYFFRTFRRKFSGSIFSLFSMVFQRYPSTKQSHSQLRFFIYGVGISQIVWDFPHAIDKPPGKGYDALYIL